MTRIRDYLIAFLWLTMLTGMRCQGLPIPEPPPGPGPSECQFLEAKTRAVRRVEPRVIHGTPADLARYPWMCSLQTQGGRHYCTGTVIAEQWVLTAAHCQPAPGERVVAGTADLREGGQVRYVAEALIHEQYVDWSEGHDLALVRLADPFVGIPAVELSDVLVPGASARVAGWGRTCATCPTSPVLLEAELRLLSQSECALTYPGRITDTMVCASGAGRDAAPGDSGGFLGQDVGGQFAQVGTTSWGRHCTAADPEGDPEGTCVGVYARLAGEIAGIRACIAGESGERGGQG